MISMDIDMSTEHWDHGECPKYDCKKDACKCGLKKVFLAAALGDDSAKSPIAPKQGDYCNAIVVYEANGNVYIYDANGVPTLVEKSTKTIEELVAELEEKVSQEEADRKSADDVLQQEIDDIKNSPDVVDIVPTYSALQAYDTSKIGNNDIVRVLADETHAGQSTYYKWNATNSTWVYIGEAGDYYTKTQTDTLLSAKQDKLIAGSNIQIASDGKTISATDTTYSVFTGATSGDDGSTGLVPAPLAGDEDKYLKADGTWSTVSGGGGGGTYTAGNGIDITNDIISIDETVVQEKLSAGTNVQINGTTISATDTTYSNFVGTDGQSAGTPGLVPAPAVADVGEFLRADGTWASPPGSSYAAGTGINISGGTISIDDTVVQEKLTAGTNIQIDTSTNTISATDTTYTAGSGISISAQNVISASPNNINSNDWSGLWQ